MNSEGLGAKWIFYYFQVFGLHSMNDKRSFSLYFQILLFAITVLNFAMSIYALFVVYSGTTVTIVSILESK